jgi:hypothetical protein
MSFGGLSEINRLRRLRGEEPEIHDEPQTPIDPGVCTCGNNEECDPLCVPCGGD